MGPSSVLCLPDHVGWRELLLECPWPSLTMTHRPRYHFVSKIPLEVYFFVDFDPFSPKMRGFLPLAQIPAHSIMKVGCLRWETVPEEPGDFGDQMLSVWWLWHVTKVKIFSSENRISSKFWLATWARRAFARGSLVFLFWLVSICTLLSLLGRLPSSFLAISRTDSLLIPVSMEIFLVKTLEFREIRRLMGILSRGVFKIFLNQKNWCYNVGNCLIIARVARVLSFIRFNRPFCSPKWCGTLTIYAL